MILSQVKSQPSGNNVKETSDFTKKMLRTRKDNLKFETSIWKSKNKPSKRHNKNLQFVCYTFSAKNETPKGNNKNGIFV